MAKVFKGKRRAAPKRSLIRRKRFARRPQQLVNRALHPIPQRFITKLKYSEVVSTGATFGNFAMNLNSLWDPNSTGIGHQPYGFDQLATLYNRYRVISCGYRLQLGLGTTTIPITLTAMPANTAVVATTASEIRENPRAKYILQAPGGGAMTLSGKCYIPSLVGRTKAQYMADDRYQAEVTTSPAELAILNLQTFNTADSAVGGVSIQVLMEYTVEFFDIKSLGQS